MSTPPWGCRGIVRGATPCTGWMRGAHPAPVLYPAAHGFKASHPAANIAGFTMIELATVLTLFGIILSIAGPRLQGLVSYTQNDRALVQVTGDIAYTRMLAVRSGRSAELVTDAAGGSYLIRHTSTPGSLKSVDVAAEQPGTTLSPSLTLRFDSRGILRSGGSPFIVAERLGQRDSILVLPTGRAYREY